MLLAVKSRSMLVSAALVAVVALAPVACHKQEQAVVGVAKTAVNAEQQAQAAAQAAASQNESLRAQLERIPLPTKSLYVNIHDAAQWANPFVTVNGDTVSLRSGDSAHRAQTDLHPEDLDRALIALPPSAWRYGRVLAIAEQTNPSDRARVRRTIEAVNKRLNDLGIVVVEWPTH